MSEIDSLRDSLESIYGLPSEQAVERLIGIYQHTKSLQSALDEIGQEAKERLTEAGIGIPFPQRVVHLAKAD